MYASGVSAISVAEILHPFYEVDDSRFDSESPLEQVARTDNPLAQELNSPHADKPITYLVGKRKYEFLRIGNEVFAFPIGLKMDPILMGSTPQEFLKYLEKLNLGEIEI